MNNNEKLYEAFGTSTNVAADNIPIANKINIDACKCVGMMYYVEIRLFVRIVEFLLRLKPHRLYM